MANVKKAAFTLGVAGMTLMSMKSIAQNQESLIKEFKKQQQVELREFKSAIDSAFAEFKSNQEKKYENFYAAMRNTVNNTKYAEELAKPWGRYDLNRNDVEDDNPLETQKYKKQKTH